MFVVTLFRRGFKISFGIFNEVKRKSSDFKCKGNFEKNSNKEKLRMYGHCFCISYD